VINHLQTVFEDDNVAIACIYCDYKEQTEQTVTNLVASLLKQILQDRCSTSETVMSLYKHHRNKSTRPTLGEFTEALKSELGMYSKIFIVVDALDECPEENGTRANLLKALRSLGGTVNLMVTSRDLPSIAREFQRTKRLDIRANDSDVQRYIEGRIARASRRHLIALRECILNTIVENVKCM